MQFDIRKKIVSLIFHSFDLHTKNMNVKINSLCLSKKKNAKYQTKKR